MENWDQNLLVESTEDRRVVNIADVIMGGGKTSAAIRYINQSPPDEKILFVSPYNKEGDRIERACQQKDITALEEHRGAKMNDLRYKVFSGRSAAGTHTLLSMITDDILERISEQNYTLILDEAVDVTRTASRKDISTFNYIMLHDGFLVDEETNVVSFANEKEEAACRAFSSEFTDLVTSGNVQYRNSRMVVWLFPLRILAAFKRILMLTYMVEGSTAYYYFLGNGYEANMLGVRKTEDGGYEFCPKDQADKVALDLKDKIHIVENRVYNKIGDADNSLTSGWYQKNKREQTKEYSVVTKKVRNVFKNYFRCRPRDFFWTCYKEYEEDFADKNIKKRFLSCNMRATNEWANCHYLAYPINFNLHPDVYAYFKSLGYTMDKDKYSLSMMVQWVWRSAIRKGEEIWLYVPSARMRGLFTDWLEEVSGG